jgi:hypothetical protein
MSEYRVYLTTTASFTVTVEAETEDEAIDLAYDEAPSSLCAHCSGYGQHGGVDLGGEWQMDDDGIEQVSP